MVNGKGHSAQILERLMSSYGVSTQKDLAAALAIPANNISGWTQRDSVPGNSIIKCALDTGADLQWLVTGELANANMGERPYILRGESLYNEITSNGGKPVLRRVMDAYGFTMQKQLCELLGISSGTVSTWVRRNYFPGDVVVTCALDTGVSLKWLATGKGTQHVFNASENKSIAFPRKNLNAGVLHDDGFWIVDLTFFPEHIKEPLFIKGPLSAWIVDVSIKEISNGRWLLNIGGKLDVYDVTLLPNNKINVSSSGVSFFCGVNELTPEGKVIFTINYDY
ncbi:phage repressor protein CI [Pantoea sp. At-9b]|uniref:phage repressor protein CI n=1 Tax=Pantoea sp. (strain At-9b) TaxID=592316 RepID=UPI0005A0EFE0|nr:phage repressor protein CI [Pantoea sp. At-9b]